METLLDYIGVMQGFNGPRGLGFKVSRYIGAI